MRGIGVGIVPIGLRVIMIQDRVSRLLASWITNVEVKRKRVIVHSINAEKKGAKAPKKETLTRTEEIVYHSNTSCLVGLIFISLVYFFSTILILTVR